MEKEQDLRYETVKLNQKLQEQGICTRGFGTFGCACKKCYEEIIELTKDI